MLYKTHIAGGLALGYIAFNNIAMLNVDISDSKSLIIVTSGLMLGSLFPDIDHRNSYLSRKVKPISCITSKIFRHREFTHSIVGTILMSYLFYLLLGKFNINPIYANVFIKAFTIGIISHILLDMMTVSGVVLFYPLYKKKVRLWIFNTSNYYRIRARAKEIFIMVVFILVAFIAYTGLV